LPVSGEGCCGVAQAGTGIVSVPVRKCFPGLVIGAGRQYIPHMWSVRLTRIVVALTVAAFPPAIADGVLASHANRLGLGMGMIAIAALLAVPSMLVALSVGRRRTEGLLAPMLALTGFLPALALLVSVFEEGPASRYAVPLSQGSWVLLFSPAALLVLFFPEGRVRGHDRWLAWAIVLDALLFIALGATSPHPYESPYEKSPHVFGTLPHVVAVATVAVTLPGILVMLVLTVVSLVRRYRRAGVELRAQMKWLALAAMVLPLTLLTAWVGYVLHPIAGEALVFVGLGLAYVTIPTVIGIAVLRPDLFEVDRVLASTMTHAIATGVALAIFTAANLAAGVLLPGDSVLAAVATTSLCALLLAPLRARLQRRVDRWLYPARRAALAAIDELTRQTTTAQARPEQLEGALQRALGDATLRLGFVAADRLGVFDLAGAPLEAAPVSVPVRLGGEQIGLVGASRTSRELLADVAAAAAPVVEVIRLRLGLRQALRDVEASRSRMLRFGYEERQRLERDLHDGAQLRLVSLGMALRLAQRHLANGGVDVHGLLDQAVAELGTAVSELRQLANGIRPNCLDDGLAPALSVLIDTVPIPVEMRVSETKVGDDLQTTAYYVASEAIANAVKHSRATRIALHVDARADDLYVHVEDDGIGGAEQRDGSGLARLADRVGAHGGTLFVSSPRDGGTTVEAILPCAS
jgi:signal transduction histidine kinase